jgi:predicted transcriptional regulator
MTMKTLVREQAQFLLEQLPDDATWEDLQYAIYVRQAVEAGEADIKAGKFFTADQVRQRFGLPIKI